MRLCTHGKSLCRLITGNIISLVTSVNLFERPYMATLDLDKNQAAYQIRAFKPGMIQVNESIFTRSIIISPDHLIEDWAPQVITELSAEALLPIIELKPDILLIGTGATLVFP